MKPKEPRISVRVTEDLKKRLAKVEEKTGIDEAILVRRCVEALVDYVETHGEITLPLIVKPKSGGDAPSTKYRQSIDTYPSMIEDRLAKEKPVKKT